MDRKLEAYGNSNAYPFHMPGHKRNAWDFPNPYKIDITEITGFDNLHHPSDILKEFEQRWANLYGAGQAYFMVNGSTGGILTAVFSSLGPNEELLLARNCHGSAYHGAFLKDVKVHYIYPKLIKTAAGTISGQISPKDLEESLKRNPKIKAVLFTSPTYEGVISDVKALAEIAHSYGVKVIVDCAHGAHFGICNSPYENPVTLGADLVIVSLHKTLPAFTSTALLLKSKDCSIEEEQIRFYLDCFETSSPSYILMASAAKCLRFLEEEGQSTFLEYEKKLKRFYEETKNLKKIKVLENLHKNHESHRITSPRDLGKILISGEGYLLGSHIFKRLSEEFYLELEMSAGGYCLAMTSIMDSDEGLNRLKKALYEIDDTVGEKRKFNMEDFTYPKPLKVLSMKDAMEQKRVIRPLESAKDCISAGFVEFYPPGIPILAPGELITGEIIRTIEAGIKGNLSVLGVSEKGIYIVD